MPPLFYLQLKGASALRYRLSHIPQLLSISTRWPLRFDSYNSLSETSTGGSRVKYSTYVDRFRDRICISGGVVDSARTGEKEKSWAGAAGLASVIYPRPLL